MYLYSEHIRHIYYMSEETLEKKKKKPLSTYVIIYDMPSCVPTTLKNISLLTEYKEVVQGKNGLASPISWFSKFDFGTQILTCVCHRILKQRGSISEFNIKQETQGKLNPPSQQSTVNTHKPPPSPKVHVYLQRWKIIIILIWIFLCVWLL